MGSIMGHITESEKGKRPFFSIVMPAYGVEKYIRRAIESIQAQEYDDWEIIVIDDCSPDRSIPIAREMAAADPRIRIVCHEENKGVSEARNTGIDESVGRYIWFMDSDDYVDPDLLIKVKKSLEKNPAEVVLFGLIEEYYDRSGKLDYTHVICPKNTLLDSQEALRREVITLEQQTLYGYPWNKVYQADYLKEKKFRYESVALNEDFLFNVKVFMDIQKLNLLAFAPYHYGKRQNTSLTNKFVPEYFPLHKRRIELLYEQHQYWGLCTKEVRQTLGSLYGRYILSALERNCDPRAGMNHSDRYRWCRGLFNQAMFNDLIPPARAKESKALSVALFLLRGKRTFLCLAMGRGVHMIRSCMPMIYSKVKSGR